MEMKASPIQDSSYLTDEKGRSNLPSSYNSKSSTIDNESFTKAQMQDTSNKQSKRSSKHNDNHDKKKSRSKSPNRINKSIDNSSSLNVSINNKKKKKKVVKFKTGKDFIETIYIQSYKIPESEYELAEEKKQKITCKCIIF